MGLLCNVTPSPGWNTVFYMMKHNHLLAIGYNVGEDRKDSGYYDLLASEARVSVFVAIAQGELPQESWFALGSNSHECRWRADTAFVERFHVRIPDAATGYADL